VSEEAVTGSDAALAPIQHVRAAERQWEARLTQFSAQAKAELDRLGAEAEAAIASARVEAEGARTELLERTRADTEALTQRLLAEGKATADAIHGKTAAELATLRAKLISAVVGPFGPSSS
jgi:vacuolar-type H+-ATPase subunit H